MSRQTHPWGVPPWSVDFRPAPEPLPDRVDFAIVGGGFTGLCAAAWLARLAPKQSVRVLAGYQKILRTLRIDSGLELPGVYELGRADPAKDSPICWSDSGDLKVVRTVPGGAVDPGKVVARLARAAEKAGAHIIEHAEVQAIESSDPPCLRVRRNVRGRVQQKNIRASQILLAVNAFSLELSGLRGSTQPKLTLAMATAPLSRAQLQAIGLSSRRPFYTVDLPYLWGRLLDSNGLVFGAGLVPAPTTIASLFGKTARERSPDYAAPNLYPFDVRKGEAARSFRWREDRVRHLHPALESVRITHRWAGPILFTEGVRPVFRRHPRSKNVAVLAGYNGHGV